MAASDNLRAAGLMTLGMAGFALSDACMKLVSALLPLDQAIALRGVLTVAALGALAAWQGSWRARLPRRDWARIGLRTLAEVAAAWLFLAALFRMPLANVSAILQALPLTVSLGAALFLAESMGWRRLTAIAVGFVGVLMIVQPGTDGFTVWSLLAVGSVLTVAVRDLATRRMSAAVPSGLVALCAACGVTGSALLVGLRGGWVDPPPVAWGALAVSAAAVVTGYLMVIGAMRWGEVSSVAPFRYTGLIWSLLLGLTLFGSWPDRLTLAGSAVVIASGLYTLWRETRRRRE
ncbi:MAG: DMT family transporter [Rhodobacterales bacterium]|nr:DMT family transporter [Rhodobacterales bacterium]